ncbi:MAG: glycine betaine ABC transporter substrate-binding protein, partial [Roseobacter sp.]
PAAWAFLSDFQFDTATQETMMKAIDQEGEKIEDVVGAWVENNSDTWSVWVAAATK